ncbi:MAG: hypothetical protein H6555_04405 [Lewinellaceae bacterium]|nr:hypothetical protein [Lewinellaceae bacterium]
MSQTKPLSARQPLEEQIIRLLATKSQAAITLIYEGYGGALYHVILKIVGQAELAQEVLQDSLVKIWQNSTQYDAGKARLFTWMVQICRNAAIDARRSRRFKEGEKTKELPDFVSNVERFSENQRQGILRCGRSSSAYPNKTSVSLSYYTFRNSPNRRQVKPWECPWGL